MARLVWFTCVLLAAGAPGLAQMSDGLVLDVGIDNMVYAGSVATTQAMKNKYGLGGGKPAGAGIPCRAYGSLRSLGRAPERCRTGAGVRPVRSGLVAGAAAAPSAAQMQGSAPRLTYTAAPALRRQALADYAARIGRKDARAAESVRQQFGQHDYDRIFRGIVAPFGLSGNDLADAMTAHAVLVWMIANGSGDPRRGAVRAARDQIAIGLAADPRYASPTARAPLGEEFKLLFVTMHAGWLAAKREGTERRYGEGVAAMFRSQSGIDPRSLQLTEDGLVSRG